MPDEPTDKQLAFLKRLRYQGPPPATKHQGSVLIDASRAKQAKAKEAGREFTGLTPSQAKEALDKDRLTWLKERRKEIRQQVKDDIADHREFERDMRKYGELDRRDAFAGWILHIGEYCTESKHLNGLLVTPEDAEADPGLLPPYDTCCGDSCECDIHPVDLRDVPKGTRMAERVPEKESRPAPPRKKMASQSSRSPGTRHDLQKAKQSRSGCMTLLFLVPVVIVLLYVVAT